MFWKHARASWPIRKLESINKRYVSVSTFTDKQHSVTVCRVKVKVLCSITLHKMQHQKKAGQIKHASMQMETGSQRMSDSKQHTVWEKVQLSTENERRDWNIHTNAVKQHCYWQKCTSETSAILRLKNTEGYVWKWRTYVAENPSL